MYIYIFRYLGVNNTRYASDTNLSLVAFADVSIYGPKVTMSYKVTPPDLKEAKSYEIFLKELLIWEITTPVPEEKKGAVINDNNNNLGFIVP